MGNPQTPPVSAQQTQSTTPDYSSNPNLSSSTAVFLAMFALMAQGIELNQAFTQAGIAEAEASFNCMIDSADLEAVASMLQSGASIAGDLTGIAGNTYGAKMYNEAKGFEAAGPDGGEIGQNGGLDIIGEAQNRPNGIDLARNEPDENGIEMVELGNNNARGVDVADIAGNPQLPENDENGNREIDNDVRVRDGRDIKSNEEIQNFVQKWQSISGALKAVGQFISVPFSQESKHLQSAAQRIEKGEQTNKTLLDQNQQNISAAGNTLSAASNARTAGSAR